MGVILKFPIEDGRLIDIEATQDLDLIFHDYDIQYDMALVEMNLDGTACSNLYTVWQDDPMFVLCGAAGVVAPIVGMGIASCRVGIDAVARVAASGIQGDTDYKCLNEASALMQACEKAWRQRKPNPRDAYHRRQELRNRWNTAVRETEKVAYPHNGHLRSSFLLRSFAERKLVDVAEECFEFLYTFIERQVMFGGYDLVPENLCGIAGSCREAVASTMYQLPNWGKFRDIPTASLPQKLYDILAWLNREQAKLTVAAMEVP